jgi:11-cis-retinol dehydrogenase
MKEFGVHCAILEPGFFRTPITNVDQMTSKIDRIWQQLDDQTKLEYGQEFFENSKK